MQRKPSNRVRDDLHSNMIGKPSPMDRSGTRGIKDVNDVWVGRRPLILPGVSVGHGGVIAAQSTDTKDVPPYTIVGGNLAKMVRIRFPEETITKMLAIRWWDWDDDSP